MKRSHHKKPTAETRPCLNCEVEFPTKNCRITKKYCSTKCRDDFNNLSVNKRLAVRRWRRMNIEKARENNRKYYSTHREYFIKRARRLRNRARIVRQTYKSTSSA